MLTVAIVTFHNEEDMETVTTSLPSGTYILLEETKIVMPLKDYKDFEDMIKDFSQDKFTLILKDLEGIV